MAGLSLQDRLVRGCIAAGFQEIYILGRSTAAFDTTANEKTITIQPVASLSDIPPRKTRVFHVRDNIVIRDELFQEIFNGTSQGCHISDTGDEIFILGDLEALLRGQKPEKKVTLANDQFSPCTSHKEATTADKKLFSWLYKNTDGIVTLKIDRPISRIFSRAFARYDLSPAFYTYINGLQSVLMLLIFVSGHEYAAFLGCFMYQLVAIFDCVDGEIARAKFQKSARGAQLDTGFDMVANILFMTGLSYLLWTEYGPDYLIIGTYILSLALLAISLMSVLLYYGPKGGSFDVLAMVIRHKMQSSQHLLKIFTGVNYVLKRDFFALVFAIVGMSGQILLIPYMLLGGLLIWNLAILYNAKSILKFRYT